MTDTAQPDSEKRHADGLAGDFRSDENTPTFTGVLTDGFGPSDDGLPNLTVPPPESPSFFLAPSLVTLRGELDKMWPNRDRTSDGWIGDASHSSRISDHNPCWECTGAMRGVVRALDIDHDGINQKDVLGHLIGDKRAWYVIHDRTIWSATYGWRPQVYQGDNPHTGHIHVSILHTKFAAFDCESWFQHAPKPTLPAVDLSNMVHVFTTPHDLALPGVRRIQNALNVKIKSGLTVDGIAGPATRKEYAHWQRVLGYSGVDANGVPGLGSLTHLGRPAPKLHFGGFRVIP